VLFLDADCYPVRDVTPLFRYLDHAPVVYWEDSGCHVKPEWVGLTEAEVAAVPPVQGGQFLVDVVGGWRTLVLAHWVNQHSDYYYARPGNLGRGEYHIFGDQEALQIAIAQTGERVVVVDRAVWYERAPKEDIGFHCSEGEDGLVFIHRCGSKLVPNTQPLWDDQQPHEPYVRGLFHVLTRPGLGYRPRSRMKPGQVQRVVDEVSRRTPCNVLVFGAGADTTCYLAANPGGRTVVVEDSPAWAEVATALGADCRTVTYTTRVGDTPGRSKAPPAFLPEDVAAVRWDVTLVDGPYGTPDGPGREQPTYAALTLTTPGGIIFGHDAGPGADGDCYREYLGPPDGMTAGPPDLAEWRSRK
jgi:hypothetical protein